MHRESKSPWFGVGLATLALGVLFGPAASAAAQPWSVVLNDPSGDDHGPGDYVYPSNQAFRRGSFDLTRIELKVEGSELVVRARFRVPFWRPPETRRTDAARFVLDNGVYVQHVDIYLDQHPGRGHLSALPGRNVRFSQEEGWDRAIVLTPRPFLLRSLLAEWKPSEHVIVPTNLRSTHDTVEARVPLEDLGNPPDPSWGVGVAVAGALWENTFDAIDRLVGGPVQNALTMPVVTVAEPYAFGGGELHNWHPFVIDIVAPPGQSQEAILGRFDPVTRRLARVPMIYSNPEARASKLAAAAAVRAGPIATIPTLRSTQSSSVSEGRVREVDGEVAVLERLDEGTVKPFAIGTVVSDDGSVLGRVVVTAVYPKFILTTVVEGGRKVRPGLTVRFQRSP